MAQLNQRNLFCFHFHSHFQDGIIPYTINLYSAFPLSIYQIASIDHLNTSIENISYNLYPINKLLEPRAITSARCRTH